MNGIPQKKEEKEKKMIEKVYPIVIKMDSKEVQVGSARVKFCNKEIIGYRERWDVKLQDINIQFKKDDFLTKTMLSYWI